MAGGPGRWPAGSGKRGVRDVTLRLYPGARHELHNELCRDEFLEELDGWMERHIQAQG